MASKISRRDVWLLGILFLFSAVMFGLILRHEYKHDMVLQSEGRMGTIAFLKILDKGSSSLKGFTTSLPICEFSITDNATGAVQIRQGECPFSEDKSSFQTYYLPDDSKHKLLRIHSYWTRPIILILGFIFLFFGILFSFFFKSYLNNNRNF